MTDVLYGMLTEEEYLEQHGVKGMKWGVIRDQAAAGNRGAQKKLAKADRDWSDELHSTAGWVKVNNHVAGIMNNGGIAKFNANPKYKAIKDFGDFNDPKVKEYHNDYNKILNKAMVNATKELYGESPSGRYTLVTKKDANGDPYVDMQDNEKISHAAGSVLRFYLKTDSVGRFLGVKLLGDDGALTHKLGAPMETEDEVIVHEGMMTEEEFLAHMGITPEMTLDEVLEQAGVKGMKWGVRKSRSELRDLDKATKARDRDERDASIDAARDRYKNTARSNYKEAKATYNEQKFIVGKREARKALDKVKQQNIDDYTEGSQYKSGRETVTAVVATVAAVVVISALKTAAAK